MWLFYGVLVCCPKSVTKPRLTLDAVWGSVIVSRKVWIVTFGHYCVYINIVYTLTTTVIIFHFWLPQRIQLQVECTSCPDTFLPVRSGMFVVGPESAGAHPGPACYRKGETTTVRILLVSVYSTLEMSFFLYLLIWTVFWAFLLSFILLFCFILSFLLLSSLILSIICFFFLPSPRYCETTLAGVAVCYMW